MKALPEHTNLATKSIDYFNVILVQLKQLLFRFKFICSVFSPKSKLHVKSCIAKLCITHVEQLDGLVRQEFVLYKMSNAPIECTKAIIH